MFTFSYHYQIYSKLYVTSKVANIMGLSSYGSVIYYFADYQLRPDYYIMQLDVA